MYLHHDSLEIARLHGMGGACEFGFFFIFVFGLGEVLEDLIVCEEGVSCSNDLWTLSAIALGSLYGVFYLHRVVLVLDGCMLWELDGRF